MPNGRTGGFRITRERLRAILESHSSTEEIADLTNSPTPTSEVLKALSKFPGKEVIVEVQDGTWYIVRLDPDFERGRPNPKTIDLWFSVGEESPIFQELVEQHKQWLENLEDHLETERSNRLACWFLVLFLILIGVVVLFLVLR